jgi:hypothetical protein
MKEIKIDKGKNKQKKTKEEKESNKTGNEHINRTMGCFLITFVVAEKQNVLHVLITCL